MSERAVQRGNLLVNESPESPTESNILRDALTLLGSWLWFGLGATIGFILGERRTLSRVEEPALRVLSLERDPGRPPTVPSVVALLEELERITATDAMTGVRSRYRITLDLALASATADRFGAWLGVCMVDIIDTRVLFLLARAVERGDRQGAECRTQLVESSGYLAVGSVPT
jgi:hypothetical protein